MLSWFRADPRKKLQRQYNAKLEEAQRVLYEKGDRALHADVIAEAEAIGEAMDALDREEASK